MKVAGLKANGITINSTVRLETEPNPTNKAYLKTKKQKFNHTLKLV
jgi:GTP cyclohydrolase II